MEKKPFVVDIEKGMKYFYTPSADRKYARVPGQRIIVRLSPSQRMEAILRMALVVGGKTDDSMYITIIEETAGNSFFDPVYVPDELFNKPEFISTFIAQQITRLLEIEGSVESLLKTIQERRDDTLREYGPLPADHGQPVKR